MCHAPPSTEQDRRDTVRLLAGITRKLQRTFGAELEGGGGAGAAAAQQQQVL
jgi:hypothetical protein